MGAGSINNPEKKYHLEINLNHEENCDSIIRILNYYGISTKKIIKNNIYSMYIKDGEEISKLLAFIGANNAVLKFEECRVLRDTRNNVNRIINCETANLNKVLNASVEQINAIKKLKENGKFEKMDDGLKEIANLRLENPDMPLVELGKKLSTPIGKSGVNYRLKKIQKLAGE